MSINWGIIQDGGAFESLMHALLYAADSGVTLFGRKGKDAGQDARSIDGQTIYQAKYRHGLTMDGAIKLALEELSKIRRYRAATHENHRYWQHAQRWILVANFSINPKDHDGWRDNVVPAFTEVGLIADYWTLEVLEGELSKHPQIRDVFFGGENRSLVGLKEAHDLLLAECVGSSSIDSPLVGRDNEINIIRDFASSDSKSVLPIIGPGGIGKSRLLYEGLALLADDGWRVLWGLPGTMAKSTQWFRLLNGSQKTCVALDDPDDRGLLRALIEQLAASERHNWKIMISCRSEKTEILRRFITNNRFHHPIELRSLDEASSKELIKGCLTEPVGDHWIHTVFAFARGVPGWMCLIAELAKRNALEQLPFRSDDIAAAYVNSCLSSLSEQDREKAKILLPWLALWGVLKIEERSDLQIEIDFLSNQGVPKSMLPYLLKDLVATGILRNWGIGKRFFAIEPSIVRQQILSSWILQEESDHYEVSREGAVLVSKLIRGEVPSVAASLKTLSNLVNFRLSGLNAELFLKPVFSEMSRIAKDGSVIDQDRILDLVEKCGSADPEGALDVLSSIRENFKDSITEIVPLWGDVEYNHGHVVSKIPWILFQIAEYVAEFSVARRYLEEFRLLVSTQDNDNVEPGKSALRLLKRILCESRNSKLYAEIARDLVAEEIAIPQSWPFIGSLLECLLSPVRESTKWVGGWTLVISRRALLPGDVEWKWAEEVREMAFKILQFNSDANLRNSLWGILAGAHQDWHRVIMHEKVNRASVAHYRAVIYDDLTRCHSILMEPPVALTIEEATQARHMWSWYLEYGRVNDPVDIAIQCETINNALSSWRVHDFFRFDTEAMLAPETARIAAIFHSALDQAPFVNFFTDVKRFLNAARRNGEDMADSARMSDLANACSDLLVLNETAQPNPLTSFAISVVDNPEVSSMEWHFVFGLFRNYILKVKEHGDQMLEQELDRILARFALKEAFLWGVYFNVHPKTTGTLYKVELEKILERESDFKDHQWFGLLGSFSAVGGDVLFSRLLARLRDLTEDPARSSNCMAYFIRSAHHAALRYNWQQNVMPLSWIIEMISIFNLDGRLIGMHDLKSMREQARFRLNICQLTEFVRSRINLEISTVIPEGFSIVPHDFSVNSWCELDQENPAEVACFYDFCRLTEFPGYIANYWMPKYISQLDRSGIIVGKFVGNHISENPQIGLGELRRLARMASVYEEDSKAWEAIARPICEIGRKLRREEREQICRSLQKHESGVFSSPPGIVADYYIDARDRASRLLANETSQSPLRFYREWALKYAEMELRVETERCEEEFNGGS